MRLIIGLLIIISVSTFCQNLVPNPGFEEFTKCPNGFNMYGQGLNIPNWYSPNTGTPDYFNECSPRLSKSKMNWAGICEEFSGFGYAGIISLMDRRAYREYLSVELLNPLDSGVTYWLQFSFRLSSYSKVSSGNLGMVFTSKKVKVNNDRVLLAKPALLAMPDSAIVVETGTWQMASGEYTASGYERFLIIGNFSETNSVYRLKYGGLHEPMLQYASFYYIDDVVVQPQIEFPPEVPVVLENDNPFEMDSVIVLKNVQFAYNSASLNKASKPELSRLLNFMARNHESRIEISGHTDDQGSEEYNQQLSLRRAEAVVDFLIGNGIESVRMKYFGFGKSRPLIDSTDELAGGINRRVEVRLVE
jgi:outer membrane protein OmpA-like peptidoglycan-associated protein